MRTTCDFDDIYETYMACDNFIEAIEKGLIESNKDHPNIYTIGKYWLPLEFCPWCGNQV